MCLSSLSPHFFFLNIFFTSYYFSSTIEVISMWHSQTSRRFFVEEEDRVKNGISNRRREGQKCEIRGIDVTFVDDSYCRERGLSFITIRKHAGSSLTFHTQQTHIYIVRVWAEVLIFNYSNIWKFGSASLHHSRLVHTHRCNVEKLKTFPFHRSTRFSQFSSTLSFHGHITLNECVEENVSIHSPHCTTARCCCYEKKNRESVPIFSIMLNKNRVVDKLNDLLTHAVFCRSMCVNGEREWAAQIETEYICYLWYIGRWADSFHPFLSLSFSPCSFVSISFATTWTLKLISVFISPDVFSSPSPSLFKYFPDILICHTFVSQTLKLHTLRGGETNERKKVFIVSNVRCFHISFISYV